VGASTTESSGLPGGVAGTAFDGTSGTGVASGPVGAGTTLDLTSGNAAGGDDPSDKAGVSVAGRLS